MGVSTEGLGEGPKGFHPEIPHILLVVESAAVAMDVQVLEKDTSSAVRVPLRVPGGHVHEGFDPRLDIERARPGLEYRVRGVERIIELSVLGDGVGGHPGELPGKLSDLLTFFDGHLGMHVPTAVVSRGRGRGRYGAAVVGRLAAVSLLLRIEAVVALRRGGPRFSHCTRLAGVESRRSGVCVWYGSDNPLKGVNPSCAVLYCIVLSCLAQWMDGLLILSPNTRGVQFIMYLD